LAASEERRLGFAVSHLLPSGEQGWAEGSWLLALRVPFQREHYHAQAAAKLEKGAVDLLPYQDLLAALLADRDQLLNRIGAALEVAGLDRQLPVVKALLILAAANGDEAWLCGTRVHGLAAFLPRMVIHSHGFSPLILEAEAPSQVVEFNVFLLPPARLADGSCSEAALAWDFFGFDY